MAQHDPENLRKAAEIVDAAIKNVVRFQRAVNKAEDFLEQLHTNINNELSKIDGQSQTASAQPTERDRKIKAVGEHFMSLFGYAGVWDSDPDSISDDVVDKFYEAYVEGDGR